MGFECTLFISVGMIVCNLSTIVRLLGKVTNNQNYQLWSRTLEKYIYVTGDHKILTNNQKKNNVSLTVYVLTHAWI